jgi:hypothetical protein
VNGVLRLTEQGEVINQSYGLKPIAMRTLERAFNALALSIGGAVAGCAPKAEPFFPAWPAASTDGSSSGRAGTWLACGASSQQSAADPSSAYTITVPSL